ncbi:MAG: DCC1-like thiol-disulfide oxidoreductase family protein [Saonia sp.]
MICAATVCTYFLSGIAKLAGDLAVEWASGSAMRSQVAVDAIRKEMLGAEAAPLFNLLFEHTWLFLGMGILTFVLELGAPLALVKRKWGMVWAVLTWMMHWGIFFIMGITFRYQMSGFMFLSFFNLEKLWNPSKKELVENTTKPVILFDGVCNLCNQWVRFILKREKNELYRFASLQSETGIQLLKDHNISKGLLSIILIEEGKVYQKSDAVLRICSNLKAPWFLGRYLRVIPKALRDKIYDFVAANRYKWFGKQQQCDYITAHQRVRFLDL